MINPSVWLAVAVSVSCIVPALQTDRPAAPASLTSRDEKEDFLRRARIVEERRTPGRLYAWRVTLDDGKSRHDAAVETADGTTDTRRNYRFNLAAYELDKTLELYLVPPTVERVIDGRPASLSWWVDEVAMAEVDRRAKKIEPPDAERWNEQIQAVRVYDELLANAYRNIRPELESEAATGPRPSYAWTELLITRDWNIWLIDHTATFRTRTQLEHPESLTRCDRALLAKLRALDIGTFRQKLGKYLSAEQLSALEIRRVALVKHFDELIARNGEGLVLYDLPRRRI